MWIWPFTSASAECKPRWARATAAHHQRCTSSAIVNPCKTSTGAGARDTFETSRTGKDHIKTKLLELHPPQCRRAQHDRDIARGQGPGVLPGERAADHRPPLWRRHRRRRPQLQGRLRPGMRLLPAVDNLNPECRRPRFGSAIDNAARDFKGRQRPGARFRGCLISLHDIHSDRAMPCNGARGGCEGAPPTAPATLDDD